MNEVMLGIYIPAWLAWLTVAVIALCIGSFLSVVIYRLPKILDHQWNHPDNPAPLSLSLPASRCLSCRTPLRLWHNIPLFSCIFLRGRCAYCQKPIYSYFFIELTTLIVWLAVFYRYGISIQFVAVVVAGSFLIALTYIDWNEKILPDELTLPLLWIGLLVNSQNLLGIDVVDAIYGCVVGYSAFFLIKWGFSKISGKEGLGQGDLKLLAAIGAWLGWQALPGIVIIASVSGLIVSIVRIMLKQQTQQQAIAFGPYLAVAGLIGLLFSDIINNPFIFLI